MTLFVGCGNCLSPPQLEVVDIPPKLLASAKRRLGAITDPNGGAKLAYEKLRAVAVELASIVGPKLVTGQVTLLPCRHAQLLAYLMLQAFGRRYLLEYQVLQLHPDTPEAVYHAAHLSPRSAWIVPDPTNMRVLISDNMGVESHARAVFDRMELAKFTASQTASCDKLTRSSLFDALSSGRWKQLQIVTHSTESAICASDGEITIDELRGFLKSTPVLLVDLVTCKASSRWAPLFLNAGVPSVSSRIPIVGVRSLADSLYYFWVVMAHPTPDWMLTIQHAWLAVQQGLSEKLSHPDRTPFPEYAWQG